MKIFNVICCILFLACAALQYNDADPYLWIPIYGYAAWVCYAAARGHYRSWACVVGIVAYAAIAAYYLIFLHGAIDWFQHHAAKDLVQRMKADRPWIEETREVLGLLILISVMAVNWFVAQKRKKISA